MEHILTSSHTPNKKNINGVVVAVIIAGLILVTIYFVEQSVNQDYFEKHVKGYTGTGIEDPVTDDPTGVIKDYEKTLIKYLETTEHGTAGPQIDGSPSYGEINNPQKQNKQDKLVNPPLAIPDKVEQGLEDNTDDESIGLKDEEQSDNYLKELAR